MVDMDKENKFVLREAVKSAQMGYFDHLAAGGKRNPAEERWIEALEAGADAISKVHVLESRLAQVEKERDALMESAKGCCETCAFVGDCAKHDPDPTSTGAWWYDDCEEWEWRGVCPENTKEDSDGKDE